MIDSKVDPVMNSQCEFARAQAKLEIFYELSVSFENNF